MNWRMAGLAVLLVVPLWVVLASGFGHDPHAVPFVLEDKAAPAFALPSVNGGGPEVKLSDFRGTPVLLNFWSTWCEPCKLEHGTLQRAAVRSGGKLKVVGVVYQDEPETVRAYLKARGSVYPQLMDDRSATAIAYGVSGVPESFLIDKNGRLRAKRVGIVDNQLLKTWTTMLAQETP